MSASDDTTEEARAHNATDRRNAINMLRRLLVGVTRLPFWSLTGVRMIDGIKKETIRAELFSNIGFHSRPKPGSNAEAIVGHMGGPDNPCIIATRDEDLRKAVAKLEHDETATFNSLTIVHHTNEGFVEIRTPRGAAFALPTLAEFNALRNAFNSHSHVYAPGPGTPVATTGPGSITDPIPVPPPVGTRVLKTE